MRAAPELSTTYAPTFALPPSVVTNAARTTVVRTPIGRASGDAAPAHADHAYQLNTATSGSWSNEQAPSRGGARPGRGAGTSVGRCRWRRMRSITEASSISAISRKRPPQRGQAKTSIPPPSRKRYGVPRRSLGGGGNVRRIKSAQRRASSRGRRPLRPQGGSGAGSVARALRGSTCSPAVGAPVVLTSQTSARSAAVSASAVLASPRPVVFPKATTRDRHAARGPKTP